MAKDFDYKTALVKLIGKNQEYILGGDGIKVNNNVVTKVTTWDSKLEFYSCSYKFREEEVSSDVIYSVYVIVNAIREGVTQKILDINKELQRIAGYDVRYYKPENWRKSFDTYTINRLLETLEDYQNQLNFKKNGK